MIEFFKGLPPEWRADLVFLVVLLAREVSMWLNNRWRNKVEGHLGTITQLLKELVKTNEKLHDIRVTQSELDKRIDIIERTFPEIRINHHK